MTGPRLVRAGMRASGRLLAESHAMMGSLRVQLQHTRRKPGDLQALVLAPLFTVVLLGIIDHADRPDLVGHAVLAPALIAVVGMSLLVAGEIIDEDRMIGALEPTVASPAALSTVVVGRVVGITVLGLVGFVESWLVAWLVFGVMVDIAHPAVFAATLAAVAVGMAATSTFMAALFVLARSARTFQNALSYPLYALGGVMVPVALLPVWIQPVSRLIYLSWAADLLRDSLSPEPVTNVAARLGAIFALSALAFVGGKLLLGRIVDRVRHTGEIAHG